MAKTDAKGYLQRKHAPIMVGLAAVVVAIALAWAIIGNTAADTLGRSEPEAALSWRSENAPALIALARRNLSDKMSETELAVVEAYAERALTANPLEEQAIGILGVVAEAGGNQEKADRLMALAAQRSRREAVVEVWSFFHEVRQGNFDAAVEHADALLRTGSSLQDEVAPTLVAFAVDDEAKNAIVDALAKNPPWRDWYLRELAKQTDDPGISFAVLSDLRDSPFPPNDSELRAYLDNLISAERFEQAYLAWLTFLPEDRRRSIHFAYNGDFENVPTYLPFDWTIQRITGATTEVVEIDEDNHAVRIEFANRRVPFRHLRKLLMLPPGGYELSARAKAERLENERGLVWQIACADGDKQRLAETTPIKGTADWHRISAAFSVPHTGCRAQWLSLVLPARVALEQEIGGTVWFDDIGIERDGKPPPA